MIYSLNIWLLAYLKSAMISMMVTSRQVPLMVCKKQSILAHLDRIYNPLPPKMHINQDSFLIYPALLHPVLVKLHYSNITHQSNFFQGE